MSKRDKNIYGDPNKTKTNPLKKISVFGTIQGLTI